MLHCTYFAALCCALLCFAALHCASLRFAVLRCAALTSLHFTALHFVALTSLHFAETNERKLRYLPNICLLGTLAGYHFGLKLGPLTTMNATPDLKSIFK